MKNWEVTHQIEYIPDNGDGELAKTWAVMEHDDGGLYQRDEWGGAVRAPLWSRDTEGVLWYSDAGTDRVASAVFPNGRVVVKSAAEIRPQFVPGPWHEDGYRVYVGGTGYDRPYYMICELKHTAEPWDFPIHRTIENLRLIAAAPELLSVSLRMLSAFDDFRADHHKNKGPQPVHLPAELEDARVAMDAVVRKAINGEDPDRPRRTPELRELPADPELPSGRFAGLIDEICERMREQIVPEIIRSVIAERRRV